MSDLLEERKARVRAEWEHGVVSRKDARARGLKHYFTGKPCRRGHTCERTVGDKKCVECLRVRGRARYWSDPEKRREAMRAARAADPERAKEISDRSYKKNRLKLIAQKLEYAARNADALREYRRTRYAAKRDKIKSQSREYRRLNPDKVAEANRNWRLNNPEEHRRHSRLRKARKRGAEGSFTVAATLEIRSAQKNRCAYCRKKLDATAHLDHIVPLAKGGSNWRRNLQWLCAPCNVRKKDADAEDFARSKGLLI